MLGARRFRAVGLLRTRGGYICCFDERLTLEQIKEYRLMGYGVAVL